MQLISIFILYNSLEDPFTNVFMPPLDAAYGDIFMPPKIPALDDT